MTVVRRIVDQVRGLITRAFHAVRQEWRTGRVSFNGLAPVDRLAAGLAMGVIVVARVVVVAATLELGWPGRVAEVPGFVLVSRTQVPVPALAILVACVGQREGGHRPAKCGARELLQVDFQHGTVIAKSLVGHRQRDVGRDARESH